MFSQKRTANHGPNAVSFGHLRGCWSTARYPQGKHLADARYCTTQGIVQQGKVLYNTMHYGEWAHLRRSFLQDHVWSAAEIIWAHIPLRFWSEMFYARVRMCKPTSTTTPFKLPLSLLPGLKATNEIKPDTIDATVKRKIAEFLGWEQLKWSNLFQVV